MSEVTRILSQIEQGEPQAAENLLPPVYTRDSLFRRYWIYLSERFPLLAHGLLIAGFSVSTVGYTSARLGLAAMPTSATIVAFVLCFLFFLQLRIADEYKDFEVDARYRPERPVPRGLVSLRELGAIAVMAGVVQLGLAIWLDPRLPTVLAIVWAYYLLMTVEFFVPAWLESRPIAYMISHLMILPLLASLASACVWLPVRDTPPNLTWFLAFSYCSGAVLELARKIRAPSDELTGVRTYSALWGAPAAVCAWLAALLLTAVFGAMAARDIDFLVPLIACFAVLLPWGALLAWSFLSAPSMARAKRLEAFAGVWVLLNYLILGVAPLYLHSYALGRESTP